MKMDLPLNDLYWLICHKTKRNQTYLLRFIELKKYIICPLRIKKINYLERLRLFLYVFLSLPCPHLVCNLASFLLEISKYFSLKFLLPIFFFLFLRLYFMHSLRLSAPVINPFFNLLNIVLELFFLLMNQLNLECSQIFFLLLFFMPIVHVISPMKGRVDSPQFS